MRACVCERMRDEGVRVCVWGGGGERVCVFVISQYL